MLRVEFKSTTHSLFKKKGYCVVINGLSDDNAFLNQEESFPISSRVNIERDDIKDIIINQSFEEIGKYFRYISFPQTVDWWNESKAEIEIINDMQYEYSFSISVGFNVMKWNKPWTVKEFLNEFRINAKSYSDSIGRKVIVPDTISYKIQIYSATDNSSLIIKDEILKDSIVYREILEITNKTLKSRVDEESLITYFKFPDKIKTIATQYLIYFKQFLADLGIDVQTEIKEDVNRVLFKITPKDREDALYKIREALEIYLQAPTNPEFSIQASNYTDIAVRQWEANVNHLKSQLMPSLALFRTTLEAKNEEIKSKNELIEMLQQSLVQYKQNKKSSSIEAVNKEDIFDGMISIKPYEGKGFSIDAPKIFRKLKRLFIKDDFSL